MTLRAARWDDMERWANAWPRDGSKPMYRFALGRRWAPGPTALWIMLNPSEADHLIDDQTMRKVVGFSSRWGLGAAVVVNLFAVISKLRAILVDHPDPQFGSYNDDAIREAATGGADTVIAAWGEHDSRAVRDIAEARARFIFDEVLADVDIYRLGSLTRTRRVPRHPSRASYALARELHRSARRADGSQAGIILGPE